MSIKEALSAMAVELEEAQVDCDKFENGNDAAGRRVRSALMNISKACKELRTAIQNERNARKA